MKNLFLILVTVFCAIMVFHSPSAAAEPNAETYIGAPEMCIDTTRIKETIIIGDHTILFKMQGGKIYINRLPFHCYGLKAAGGFGYRTSLAKLCKQDIISVLWPSSDSGSKCGLGDFWPLEYDGESKDVINLLKEGLLEKLVKENAFQKDLNKQ